MDKETLFVLSSNEDMNKPIKLVFDNNDYNIANEYRLLNNKEIKKEFKYALLNMKYAGANSISSQQYRSEMGKVRRNQFEEVLNFITKRSSLLYTDLKKYMNEEQEFITMSVQRKFDLNYFNKSFGIIELG